MADDPGDETQTEINNLGSSDVGAVVQPGHCTAKPSLDERLRNALDSQTRGQGQHANCVAEQTPKLPSPVKGKPESSAGGKATRVRDSNWDDEQKSKLLMGKLKWHSDRLQQALGGDQSSAADHHGKSWSHEVAVLLSKTHQQCQRQWDTLLKSRNAIRDHERKYASGTHVLSFWNMTDSQKDTANHARRGGKLELLPRAFTRERYELMEFILNIVEGVKKIPSWKNSFQKTSGSAVTSYVPLDSGITESLAVGQVSDVNTSQDTTINDNLAITEGKCEGAEDLKVPLKKDHNLVSLTLLGTVVKDALQPYISKLQSRKEKQKYRDKELELAARKIALQGMQLEYMRSMRNATSGQAELSNMRCNGLADGQHVQAYGQMTPSGTYFPHPQNGANANSEYHTGAGSVGQATHPNLENVSFRIFAAEFLNQPSTSNSEPIGSCQIHNEHHAGSSEIQSNTPVQAGNEVRFLPTNNNAWIQQGQHHDGPSEIQSNTPVQAGNEVRFLPTNNNAWIQQGQHHDGPSEIQSNTPVQAGNEVRFLPTNNNAWIQQGQHHDGPSEIQSNTPVQAGNEVRFLPTNNNAWIQQGQHHDGPSEIQSNTPVQAGNEVRFLPTNNNAWIQQGQHHDGPSEIQSNTPVQAGNEVRFLPTNNNAWIQQGQHHDGPSEIQSSTPFQAGNRVQSSPTENDGCSQDNEGQPESSFEDLCGIMLGWSSPTQS